MLTVRNTSLPFLGRETKKAPSFLEAFTFFGGRRGTRTPDPLGVNEML